MNSIKISILTATYNRGRELEKLYQSIKKNCSKKIEIEWLIMDDGSIDETEHIVRSFDRKFDIKYYKHDNMGKMASINELVEKAIGDLIIECDSDDYFTDSAFEYINIAYEKYKNYKDVYALCFLKYNKDYKNIGKNMPKKKTNMFDLYFKDLEDGEKSLVYYANIRKKYKYRLEKNEKFVTEARMHHEMDLSYSIICINKPIMICEYQQDGYTKNINSVFQSNPYGYYEYFREILHRDMKGVNFSKRLYCVKHLILFSYLTGNKLNFKDIKSIMNKILLVILIIPGIYKSKKFKEIENGKRKDI